MIQIIILNLTIIKLISMFWIYSEGKLNSSTITDTDQLREALKIIRQQQTLPVYNTDLADRTQYLRRTIIDIPKSLSEEFPNNDTLRIGYDSLLKQIYLFLVPKKGSGKLELIAEKSIKTKYEATIVTEARCLSRDINELENLLSSYLEKRR